MVKRELIISRLKSPGCDFCLFVRCVCVCADDIQWYLS